MPCKDCLCRLVKGEGRSSGVSVRAGSFGEDGLLELCERAEEAGLLFEEALHVVVEEERERRLAFESSKRLGVAVLPKERRKVLERRFEAKHKEAFSRRLLLDAVEGLVDDLLVFLVDAAQALHSVRKEVLRPRAPVLVGVRKRPEMGVLRLPPRKVAPLRVHVEGPGGLLLGKHRTERIAHVAAVPYSRSVLLLPIHAGSGLELLGAGLEGAQDVHRVELRVEGVLEVRLAHSAPRGGYSDAFVLAELCAEEGRLLVLAFHQGLDPAEAAPRKKLVE